ncbi:MAG: hypothetical protein LBQ48_06350 [Oscillospiraceae bacterium]|nr:hypothetical protein [Oscillospiraceae bacterium]
MNSDYLTAPEMRALMEEAENDLKTPARDLTEPAMRKIARIEREKTREIISRRRIFAAASFASAAVILLGWSLGIFERIMAELPQNTETMYKLIHTLFQTGW